MHYTRYIILPVAAGILALSAAPAFAESNCLYGVGNCGAVASGTIMKVGPGAHPTPVGLGIGVSANASGAGFGQLSIDARIQMLENILSRIEGSTMISASAKANLITAIQNQIAHLKAIEAGGNPSGTNSSPTLSSADSAGFFFVLSNGSITQAADHFLAVAGQLANLSAKLQARINSATNVDQASLNADLTDMNNQIATAKTAANAALADVANVSTDASASASTSGTFRDAVAQLAKARTAIEAAYKDAFTILKALGVNVPMLGTAVSASATANVNAQ